MTSCCIDFDSKNPLQLAGSQHDWFAAAGISARGINHAFGDAAAGKVNDDFTDSAAGPIDAGRIDLAFKSIRRRAVQFQLCVRFGELITA